jgi:hypothetical protein
MSDEIEETGQVETPAPEQTEESPRDRQGRFAKAVEAVVAEETPQEAPAPETPEVVETPEAAGEAPEVVAEGPTDNMLAVARAVGIPEDVIANAQSDRDLRLIMTLAPRFQTPRSEAETPQREQIAPEPDFAFEWPEDEVPPTDPLRRELERLAAFYKDRDAKREEDFNALAEYTVAKGKTEQQRAEIARQQEFDKLCDGIGIKDFGDSTKLTPKVSPEWHLRNQEYGAFKQLTEQLGFTPEQAINAIAVKHGGVKPPAQPNIAAVVRQQAQSRLGGGPSRPAPSVSKTREEKWAEALAAKGS